MGILMVHSIECCKDGTAHGNRNGLLYRMSLRQEYGTVLDCSVGASDSSSNDSKDNNLNGVPNGKSL